MSQSRTRRKNERKSLFSHFFVLPQKGFIRSSRPGVFFKKGILRNFAKFTGKHLCQSLFFNKVAYQKSGTQDPKVGLDTQDPRVGP